MKVEVSMQQRGLLALKEYLVEQVELNPLSPFLMYGSLVGITVINALLLTPSEMLRLQSKIWLTRIMLFTLSFAARMMRLTTDLMTWGLCIILIALSAIIVGLPYLLFLSILQLLKLLPESPARQICLTGMSTAIGGFSMAWYIVAMTAGLTLDKRRNLFDNIFDLSRKTGGLLKRLDDTMAADIKRFNQMDVQNAQRMVQLSIAEGLDSRIDEEHIHALIYQYLGTMRQFEWKRIKQRRIDELVFKSKRIENDTLGNPRWEIHIGQGRLNYLLRNGVRFQWALVERDVFIPIRLAHIKKDYPSLVYWMIHMLNFVQWSYFLVGLLIRDAIINPLYHTLHQWSEDTLYVPRTWKDLLSRRPRTGLYD